ncbi:aba 3 protein [Teratosphaeria destructans]|uniref:Aba 3 protein n=1 Tax=Teratosphaeria destructans TaxID=418781 RepID=A0A9W7T0T2_9PEZI|nr:aba 3 protein [Teratosphaeria destructans]
MQFTKVHNKWYYPPDIADDLRDVALPEAVKQETLACAWEYTRCIIPQYTNWSRYVAFMRTIIIGIIAEFRGNMVDVSAGDDLLGYDLGEVLDDLFLGTSAHKEMAREYRSFLLITADKTSGRRQGQLFTRYVRALAVSPGQWFRMRDSDSLSRFSFAAALACNDYDTLSLTDAQMEIISEIAITMYDATAFFKHRSEGETNNTFAYVPPSVRIEAFHQARQVLWALDVAMAAKYDMHIICNFVRFFGGPIHMMMRRYRYVEEGLTIGRSETHAVIEGARKNDKLWNRVDAGGNAVRDLQRFQSVLAQNDLLMFDGLAGFLQQDHGTCTDCKIKERNGAVGAYQFGGVQLCNSCGDEWEAYVKSLPERASAVFPELSGSV